MTEQKDWYKTNTNNGYCMCGCGELAPIAKRTTTSEGISKGSNWAKEVKIRDNYTCQCCGQIGYILHSHHLMSFSKYPEIRLDLDNGITLCEGCHFKAKKLGDFKYKNELLEILIPTITGDVI